MPGEMQRIGMDLSIALSRYVTGSLSYFNHRSNININARLVCFDLKEMDANQRDLTMLIIQDTIWNRVTWNRVRGKTTWVDIDEFHLLLRSPITAAYSVEIWKRFQISTLYAAVIGLLSSRWNSSISTHVVFPRTRFHVTRFQIVSWMISMVRSLWFASISLRSKQTSLALIFMLDRWLK